MNPLATVVKTYSDDDVFDDNQNMIRPKYDD